MTFLWPSMLFSLILVPVILLVYLRMQRRRSKLAASFSGFGSSQANTKRNPGLRRHIPPAVFLAGLVTLQVALARPQATIDLPRVEGTVILVFDVSGSMAAEDANPTRMEAAKAMAQKFVLSQPETVKIGIVSFSGSGFAVQAPTNDPDKLLTAIKRLKPQTGTSLGQGILAALHTIAVDAGLEKVDQAASGSASSSQDTPQDPQQPPSESNLIAQLPEGPYPASVIVLLSDGENNMSIDPLAAAQAAADHNVRINAIGFGTTAGITLKLDGFSVHTALDEATLKNITQTAGGNYYNAQEEQDPKAVFDNLVPQLVVKPEKMEITSIFAGASLLIIIMGAVFSMVWFNRLP